MASNAPQDGGANQTDGARVTAAPSGEAHGATLPAPRRSRTRLIIACSLLAFIGGLGVMAWVMTNWQGGLRFGPPQDPVAIAEDVNATGNDAQAGDTAQVAASAAIDAQAQNARAATLEQRMARITIAAAAASGYANRAEAMMVAFAARRALDSGAPLSYLEPQLRLLFGDAQPKAVATIVNAAGKPVTLSTLRAGLETIHSAAERGNPNESWWSATMRELRGLAVIRQASDPSPELSQRIARARLDVESGQLEGAIDEVEALSETPETTLWLEQARRYKEARRALDVIETAALLEPRAAPLIAPAVDPAAVVAAQP